MLLSGVSFCIYQVLRKDKKKKQNNLRKFIILGEMLCNCVHVILFRFTELAGVQMAFPNNKTWLEVFQLNFDLLLIECNASITSYI